MLHCIEVTVLASPAVGCRRSLLVAFCLLLTWGAANEVAGQEQLTPDNPSTPTFESAPGTGVPPAGPAEEPFIVGVGDVLQIDVWREPEVSVSAVMVRSDGKISVPLVKEVYVTGLSPLEIEQVLTRKFEAFINNPVVTVIVREVHSQRVILSGGVARPGVLELEPGMTVMHAISIAGGLKDYAKRKKIFVVRGEGSKQVMIPFDYVAVMNGKDPTKDFQLEPGDMIVVPQ